MKNKALFLDLDGTLIKTKTGERFPVDKDDWEFIGGVLPIVKRFYNQGYNIVIISNQGGIEMGYVKETDFLDKLDKIVAEIEEYLGGGINYGVCKFMNSYFRKPNPGYAYKFAIEMELNLWNSIMVGDRNTDNEFAKNARIGTYYDIEDFLKL